MRRLLHVAVSDVSDDVRRAAVLNLGFVLANVPEQCPRVVRAYNPRAEPPPAKSRKTPAKTRAR